MNFSFQELKESIILRSNSSLRQKEKIPLTERNIEYFNTGVHTTTLSIFEDDESTKDALNKVQNARNIQVSEWIRLLPRVRCPPKQ
jgi:hypothetical protein